MIKYNVQLNKGNEALCSGKTITANEVLLTCDHKAVAREIHHQNTLIPEQVAAAVLENFGKAAAELMAMGFAIQFKNGEDVLMRIYPDIHVKGGNINLERAKQLDPTVTDLTVENAGDLVNLAGGVTIRARAEVETKFTEMLLSEGASVERAAIVEKAYVSKANGNGDNQGGNQSGNGGNSDLEG